MGEVELEAVLEFLRKNGLSESESALMEDVVEKSSPQLEKFFFPMPPPLRIPSARRLPDAAESSSDDEFVSLGSSSTELCSSEFTNPYGIRTTAPPSQASSDDGLSQFDTARDYPDFDMQNSLFWYKEKDEDYALPPLFNGYGDPSEDKYVMTVQTGEGIRDQAAYSLLSDESISNVEEVCKDYYDLGGFERRENDEKGHCIDYSCACCSGAGGNAIEYDDANGMKSRTRGERLTSEPNFSSKRNSTYDWIGGYDSTRDVRAVQKDNQPNSDDGDYDFVYDEGIGGEINEPEDAVNEDSGVVSGELHMNETKEDEYEIFDLRILHRKNRTGFEESKDFPIVINSIIAGRYYVSEYLGSAAFSKVIQAHDLNSGMDVCLKIIKNDKDFFDQSLDEIKLLKFVNKHDPADEHHILRLYDYFYHQEHLFIVTELLKANLYEFQKYNQESEGDPYFTLERLQVITRQILEALLFLHNLGIIHCDLKPENILIKSYRKCEIKVIDLGSSCFQTDNLSLYIQSRSYRAPEVMLGLPYDQKIDLWSVGCILAELCSGEVLFPNEAVVMLLGRMIGMLGPIDMEMLQNGQETHKYFTEAYDLYILNEETNEEEYIVPEESSLEKHLQICDSGFVDFLKCLLELNPKRRATAREALQHPWLSHSYKVNSSS